MFNRKRSLLVLFVSSFFLLSSLFGSMPVLRMASRVSTVPSRFFVQSRNFSSADTSLYEKEQRIIKINAAVYFLLCVNHKRYSQNANLLIELCVANVIINRSVHELSAVQPSEPFENAIKQLLEKFYLFEADQNICSVLRGKMLEILALNGFDEKKFMTIVADYSKSSVDHYVARAGVNLDSSKVCVLRFLEQHAERDMKNHISIIAAQMGLSDDQLAKRIFTIARLKIDSSGSLEEIARDIVRELRAS